MARPVPRDAGDDRGDGEEPEQRVVDRVLEERVARERVEADERGEPVPRYRRSTRAGRLGPHDEAASRSRSSEQGIGAGVRPLEHWWPLRSGDGRRRPGRLRPRGAAGAPGGARSGRLHRRAGSRSGSGRTSSRRVRRSSPRTCAALGEDDAFATLARVFLLGADVPAARLDEVAAPVAGRAARGARARLGRRRARARAGSGCVPHGDYVVASDAAPDAGGDLPYDHVPGIQSPSVTLAKLAVRRPCARALDLGTGCGIQALLAARHAERVVATDVNPRALGFAAFNAALNGDRHDRPPPRRRLRAGRGRALRPDRREPAVRDLARRRRTRTATAACPADELCRRVVGGAAAHLDEGGFAHVLVSWALARPRRRLGRAAPRRGSRAEAATRGSSTTGRATRSRTPPAGCARSAESDPDAYAGRARPLARASARARDRRGRLRRGRAPAPRRRRELGARGPASARPARAGGRAHAARVRRAGRARAGRRRGPARAAARADAGAPARPGAKGRRRRARRRGPDARADRRPAASRSGSTGTPRRCSRTSTGGARCARCSTAPRGTFELEPEARERFVPAALPVVRRLLELGFLEPA